MVGQIEMMLQKNCDFGVGGSDEVCLNTKSHATSGT